MTQPFFDEMFSHMSQIFAEVWGAPRALQLSDGREAVIPGIWKPDHLEEQIGDYVSQRVPWPKLDLRRQDLIAAGISDPESDLHDAIVEIDGKRRRLVEIRDDGRSMVKCRCALEG